MEQRTKPPEFFKGGAGHEKLNEWLRYFLPYCYLPADPSIIAIAGSEGGPGRMRAAAGGGTGAGTIPLPFDLIAPTDPGQGSSVRGQVNPASLFLPDESSTDTMAVVGLGVDHELQAGMYVYLQVDTDDGDEISEVSVVWNTAGFGDQRIKFADDDGAKTWDQSFYPLAQVFDNTTGEPEHGGTVFTSGDGENTLEVVNVCGSHLATEVKWVAGAEGKGVVKTAATFDTN